MNEHETKIIKNLKELGPVKEILPALPEADAIRILGAKKSSMKRRLDYASALFNKNILKAKNLILLTGERPDLSMSMIVKRS